MVRFYLWICSLLFACFMHARPLVYDCFLFLNEEEVLDIRLHEMGPYVDKFVIVESAETFRGNAKPFNFAQWAPRFAPFKDKIIYVCIEGSFRTQSPWDRETYQRNQIMRGLGDCKDDDIIFISDVDEIVRGTDMAKVIAPLSRGEQPFVGVLQTYHSNYLNGTPSSELWCGPVATTFGYLKKTSPQHMRNMRGTGFTIMKGGWHFTWQGGVEADLYKLGAYSHAESDTPEGRKAKRDGFELRYLAQTVPLDDSFPQYVRDNEAYLISIGFIRHNAN